MIRQTKGGSESKQHIKRPMNACKFNPVLFCVLTSTKTDLRFASNRFPFLFPSETNSHGLGEGRETQNS